MPVPSRLLSVALVVVSVSCSSEAPALPPEVVEAEVEGRRSAGEELAAIADALEQGGGPFFSRRRLERLEERLADGATYPPRDSEERLQLWIEFCLELLRQGEVDRAVAEVEALGEWSELENDDSPGRHWLRGLAYLRLAEVENCVRRHAADCCILPLEGQGRHAVDGPARAAAASYTAYLAERPGRLDARWILNVLAMALGEYPEGVPARWRIPPSVFDSDHDIGRFRDVAGALGVDAFNLCGGVAVEDYDGDGHLDVATSTLDPRGSMILYRGLPGLAFEDVSRASGLDEQLGGLNCIAADYDEDGDMDLLVLRGAWLFDYGRIRNSLLENDGHGRFADVTWRVGLADPSRPTQAACWGDFDADGDLDVYIGNESRLEIGPPVGDYPSQLFLNGGDRTFEDVAGKAGVTNDRYAKGVAAGDFDNDGDLDLYVSNAGPNRLYENRGDGAFADVARERGVVEPAGRSFAAWFFDYDDDGWLDLWVGAYQASLEDVVADRLGQPNRGRKPRLYRNVEGSFLDVTGPAGLERVWLPMGANFGDLDNDGRLDIFLSTGDPDFETLTPNVVMRNDRGRAYQDVTTSGGFGHLQKGHGVAFADFDHDGDQDVYNQLGGFYPGDAFSNALFENPGHGNGFLHVRLRGTRSNRNAFGARIRVVVEEQGVRREIHRAVGSVSSFGGSPHRQEVGLGAAERIVSLEVRWPAGGGDVQRFEDLSPNTAIEIIEGDESYRVVPLP